MTNFSDMLSKAKAMQEKMKEAQDQIKKIEVEGVSGGNLVKVVLTGDYELKKIILSDAAKKENQDVITESVIDSTEEKSVGGEAEVKSTDKLPKEEKEKKKRAPRKSKKVDLENSDEPKLNDEEEKAKQKRRGWWSLKG